MEERNLTPRRTTADSTKTRCETPQPPQPSSIANLQVMGIIQKDLSHYYAVFFHYPCTPICWSWRTSTVNLACFAFMKKLPLCPSSWADKFPFAPFPLKLMFCPVYKTCANGLCLPRTDVQRLALLLVLTGVTELFFSHVGHIMESFLN